ncbi:MAG: class I SAM-dependent methyltransferase [Promethearchaeota archaeon]|jgi:protein-L-isoaspartate O-methyltransferase
MIKKFLDYLYYSFEIFSNYIPFLAKLYIKFHAPSVKKEIKMLNLSSSDRILHIGCGAIPYTSIGISREIDAEIVGIDCNPRVVDIATDYLKRYNLSNMVKIEIGDGKTYSISGFDVIILSYGIDGQDLVLRHAIDSMKKGARIILRRFTTERDNYIDSIVKEFSVCSIKLLLTQESILIVKKTQTDIQ